MGADQHFDWYGAAASALDWWADAGVDILVDDTPRDWLAPPPTAPAPVVDVAPAPAAMPDELAAFLVWRGGDAAPEAAWRGVTILASGPADATAMVLLDCPDREDGDEGRLLAGASGRLFDRMLAAIGLTRDEVHFAAVCVKRPVAGRLPREAEERLHDIARHHVGLVAPKRLLVMGNAASRAILGADLMATRGSLHLFAAKNASVEVVASFHPRFLIEKPAAKAEAWRDLQLFKGGMPA